MSLQLIIGPLTAQEASTAIAALAAAGINLGTMAGAAGALPAPPQRAPAAPPPLPGGHAPAPAAPPPPPAPAAIQAPANPRLDSVIRLMDAYSKAGHKIEGVRKVLGMLSSVTRAGRKRRTAYLAGASVCEYGVGTMNALGSNMVSEDMLERAAARLFAFRKELSQDNEPGYRHPMMYGTYKWDDLPQSEVDYYKDMLKAAFEVIDVKVG